MQIFGLLLSIYLLIGLIIGLLTMNNKNVGKVLEQIPVPITQTTWVIFCMLAWVFIFRGFKVQFTGKKKIEVEVDTESN